MERKMSRINYKLRDWKSIKGVLLIAAIIFLSSSLLVAHDGSDYDIEINGTITALNDSTLDVDGVTFLVTTDTEIKDHQGNIISFSELQTNNAVETKGVLTDFGFTATRIKLNDNTEHELETTGLIENLGNNFLVVNGLTFFVNDDTEIKDHDQNIEFEDLSTDDFVEVKAELQDDTTFLANRIKIEDDHGGNGEDFETEGLIESLGDSSLVVNGMTFAVDANTIIVDDDDPISFEDLSEGDFVEVYAIILSDSSYLATKIKREDDHGGHDGEFETEGLIETLGDSSLVVNGVTFFVNENTEIKDDDVQISFGDLNVGDFVEVKAQMQDDSTFLATEIEREDGHDNEFEIEGFIDSKDSSSLVVSGITFNVNDQTEILDHEHNPITFDDLTVGMRVEVHAIIQSDSSLLATKIKVEDDNNAHIEITAPIDTIYNSTVVVSGIEFLTDSNTVILDEDHNPIALSDLEIGMTVEVKGVQMPNGSLYATRIKIEELWSSVVEFEGVLISISGTAGHVGDREFFIDDSTLIINEFGDTVDVSYLSAGMYVEVRANVQDDNSLLATRIKVDDSDSPVILGSINNLTGNSFTIGNFNVNINDYTFITNLANQESNFTDMETGLLVKVKVTQQSNGTYEASRVRVINNPNVMKSTGTVITIGPDMIVVSQPAYQLNSSTVILNSSYRPMDYSDIHPGDQVTIWADVSTIGDPLALQIKKFNNAVTNTDDGVVEPISEFSLSQNYPNPFNPATTIRFTLPEASFVSIKVYNLIGEEVATLVNNTLTGGTHSVVFDAANLASGVYLYRIQATINGSQSGNIFIQTKKMILLK
jgi:molybdopterin converting factor small subunit